MSLLLRVGFLWFLWIRVTPSDSVTRSRWAIVDENRAVVDSDCVGLMNVSVRLAVHDQLIAADDNLSIEAWCEAVEMRPIVGVPQNFRGRHARPVAIRHDDSV